MRESPIDLSDQPGLRALSELVGSIRVAAPGVQPLLVGAMARDVLLEYAHGIRAARATEDLDFAFTLDRWEDYAALKRALLSDPNFSEVRDVEHRLLYKRDRKVDLIPFGGLERADRTIVWPPREDAMMHVIGYSEALARAELVRLPANETVLVVSLPALALLKLFAWRDRRLTQPRKDASDLRLILENYLAAGNRQRLYESENHLFEDPEYDEGRAGAWMLGADVRDLFSSGDGEYALRETIALVAPEVDANGPTHLAIDMRGDLDRIFGLLTALHAGLSGSRSLQSG